MPAAGARAVGAASVPAAEGAAGRGCGGGAGGAGSGGGAGGLLEGVRGRQVHERPVARLRAAGLLRVQEEPAAGSQRPRRALPALLRLLQGPGRAASDPLRPAGGRLRAPGCRRLPRRLLHPVPLSRRPPAPRPPAPGPRRLQPPPPAGSRRPLGAAHGPRPPPPARAPLPPPPAPSPPPPLPPLPAEHLFQQLHISPKDTHHFQSLASQLV